MNEVFPPEKAAAPALAVPLKPTLAVGLLAFLFLVLCSSIALYRLAPPSAVPADAPAAEFASGRALTHLEAISRRPHAVGTSEHAAVRDYLVQQLSAQGLEPEVQKTLVASQPGGGLRVAAVENVMARLKGRGQGRAVLLAAHYDTVASSPGAADDGSSVAALLETLRALKAGAPLNNDIIFLFTDAEEIGLLGAQAFTEQHPWMRDVGVVLNFESRGAGGPVTMFETSPGNGRLIREFAAAAPRPSASSLAYEVYRLLPNSTDMAVFKAAGLPGLNFANTDGFARYHASTDTPENLDERTLQHKGSYALALARHFGDLSADTLKDGNAVYFDLLGATLVRYPVKLVLPLTILVALLFVAVAIIGLKKGRLTVGGVVVGALALLATLVAAAATAGVIWWAVAAVQRAAGRSLQDDLYRSNFYLLAFVALTIALCASLSNVFRRKIRAENLAVGSMLCWLLLLIAVSVLMPGGSYLLAWPLLFGLVAMVPALAAGDGSRVTTGRFLLASACVVPAVVLLVPTIYQFHVALGMRLIAVVALLVALLFGLLTPYFALMTSARRWLLPVGAAAVGVLFLGLAAFTMSFDGRHPATDNVSYVQNVDLKQAVWASTDPRADEWTAQFFGAGASRGPLLDLMPTAPVNYLKSPAPLLPLAPSEISVLDDRTDGGVRTLRLNVKSTHPAGYIMSPADSGAEVVAATVQGAGGAKRFVNDAARAGREGIGWSLNFYAPPAEGLELVLEVKPGSPLKLRTVDQAYGLPDVPGSSVRPRPAHLAPATSPGSDTTQISRAYSF
ncbi:MAG TPA: M20/M25/M40 family metallo-hydrolase [Pyrinomonadaceae bacterium]|jgi:Zn-dependent M28 family amino/carboxypeptidase|nr:M20/M25/M40 family metallo-hydrolase [Pyrinomonadaceae bacterium]